MIEYTALQHPFGEPKVPVVSRGLGPKQTVNKKRNHKTPFNSKEGEKLILRSRAMNDRSSTVSIINRQGAILFLNAKRSKRDPGQVPFGFACFQIEPNTV